MAPQFRPLADRFWANVGRKDTEECWAWLKYRTPAGYGKVRIGGRHGQTVRAHRVAWELTFGPIAPGLCVLHHCDNRACVNPSHLFLGNYAANAADAKEKGRTTFGARHANASLSDMIVEQIRVVAAAGVPLKALARQFGLTSGHTWQIIHGKTWQRAAGPVMPLLPTDRCRRSHSPSEFVQDAHQHRCRACRRLAYRLRLEMAR